MRKLTFFVAGFLLFAGSALAPLAGLPGGSAHAAEDESERPEETRRVPSMSEQTFKKLSEAQEAIDAKDYQGALNVLQDMLNRSKRLNGNEIGQVNNMLGFVYFSMEDYGKAIRAYESVLAQGEDIPEGLETTTLFTLAQLSFVNEQYQQALDYMETWITKAKNPGPEPHIFMGQVYYQMQNYPAAIEQINIGIEKANERGTETKEQWWALLNFLYYEQENWPEVLNTLEVLVKRFPKREYWIRLSGIHGQQGNYKEQVYAMMAARTAGFLEKETDYTNLAGLLMQEQAPIRAAQVLEEGFKAGSVERSAKNLQSLGQAYQLAQETEEAIDTFIEAAKLADDGKIYERLAQLYLDSDDYGKCIDAADNALRKGGLRKVQSTHVVRGMCLFNNDRLDTARQSFVSCRNESRRVDDESNQRICQQWITYIDRESERRRQLEAAI